jgi:hypothetical protein
VNFALIEDPVPPVVEVEDRHIENKQRIVKTAAARERSSPFAREGALRCFQSSFPLPRRWLTVHFLSRVHSFYFSWFSVGGQENGEKTD